ncbi:MAG TPA: hypothetical protein PK156_06295, partial [Polyangium sp.]|nr:hypothetical protein [Polyangium sp.]
TADLCGMPPLANQGTATGLLDFGLANDTIMQSGDRVLGYYTVWNAPGRWILWDTTTRTSVAEGATTYFCNSYLVGDLLAVQSETGIDLFDAITGQMQATIPVARTNLKSFTLADDGSYLWLVLQTGNLEVWSPNGTMLMSLVGDYREAAIFGAPTELRVGNGPAGAKRIERIPLDGSPSTISPFFPQFFHRWTVDGERFLATAGNTVSVYSKDAALVSSNLLPSVENLNGSGDYYWIYYGFAFQDERFEIYSINSGSTPIASYSYTSPLGEILTASRQTIAFLPEPHGPTVHLFHLGPAVTQEIVTPGYSGIERFTFDLTSDLWTLGTQLGVLWHHGTSADPQAEGLLGCGGIMDISGAPTGYVAVSTGANRVYVFDMNAGGAIKAIVPAWAEEVAISDDGNILATRDGYRDSISPNNFIRAFSTVTTNELHVFPQSLKFALSRNGTRMSLVRASDAMPQVTNVDETLTFYDLPPTVNYAPLPSPNGLNLAVMVGIGSQASTLFYAVDPTGGPPTLRNSVNGTAVGWLDDDHILAYTEVFNPNRPGDVYDKTIVYDAQGNVQAIPPNMPAITRLDAVEGTWFYSPYYRTVYDSQTGATIWTNPQQIQDPLSAAAGRRVIFRDRGNLYFESF